jgi:peroxiredoxin
MRKTMIAFLVALTAVVAHAQVSMNVTGECSKYFDTLLVYSAAAKKVIGKVPVKEGQFAYKGKGTSMGVYGIGPKNHYTLFFCDGTDVWINLRKREMKGSPLNGQLYQCGMLLDSVDNVARGKLMSLASSRLPQDEIQAQSDEVLARRARGRVAVLQQFRNTLIPAVYLPDESNRMSLEQLEEWLDPETPYYNHPNLQTVKRHAANLAKKRVGLKFTDLTMNDLDGQSRSLSEWCGKGKYVLLHFWYTGFLPCRRDLRRIVYCFEEFHPKGLDVVGISLDTDKQDFLRTINEFQMTWTQLTDLKGPDSPAAEAWGIHQVPANILIGPNGDIVASNLFNGALEDKLEEIFGE